MRWSNRATENLTNYGLIAYCTNVMPFTERYLRGIIRVETTTKEEQERAALLREQIPYENPFFFVAGSPAEMIKRQRTRTLFLFGLPVHKVHITDSNLFPRST